MTKSFSTALLFAASLSGTAAADTTIGVGVGSLYNGFGLNVGRVGNNSLTYASLGCISAFYTRTSGTTDGDVETSDSNYETNCGVGLGYVNTSLLPGDKHGLGLSLGYSYNTDDSAEGSEYHLMPGYHYFFNSVDQSGLNIGLGVLITRSSEKSTDAGLSFNLGYQF